MWRSPWPLLVAFAVVHALIFVPNHLLFRTYALDLGLYTHAAWTYAHGRMAGCMLFLGEQLPLLADHFDLHLILWSPLTWVFGTWTLLLLQWVAVAWGGLGMYRWLRAMGIDHFTASLGLVHFLSFFGVYGSFTFDFHSNVVATMALPWYGLMLERRRHAMAWGLLVFMLTAKEDMGFWLAGVTLGLMVRLRRDRIAIRLLAAHGMLALAWSLLVTAWVMPALSGGSYLGWLYPALGNGPVDALRLFFKQPAAVLEALMADGGMPEGRAIKVEMLVLLFLAGGWAMLLRPWILLMAVPLLLEKLLHAGPMQWGVLAHYSVGFAPLCTLAVFTWPPLRRPARPARWGAMAACLLSIAVTVHILDASVYREDRSRQRIYQSIHYTSDWDVEAIRALIRRIPSQAAVSASSPFVPHLALREHLYQFPILGQARFVLLATEDQPYPLDREAYSQVLDTLARSAYWQLLGDCNGAFLYGRMPEPTIRQIEL